MGTIAKWALYLVALPFVFGGLVVMTGGMFWGGLATFVVGLSVMAYGSTLATRPPQQAAGIEVQVDEGLWYRQTGPRSFDVLYDQTWVEDRGDESAQKPARSTLRSLNACNVQATLASEAEAVAAQTVIDNANLTCSSCGGDAMSDDARCDHCGKNPWAKPIVLTVMRRG